MKVLINRRPVEGPYGGGNLFVRAAYKHFAEFGYTPVTNLNDLPEVVLMIGPEPDELGVGINELIQYKQQRGWKCEIVHRINECDARKATTGVDDVLAKCQRFVDERVFVSNWLRDHLLQKWQGKNYRVYGSAGEDGSSNPVIYNGVDRELFKPMHPGLNWSGQTHIVTHHWSDNPMKGLDVTMWLDQYFIPKYRDRFTYTYIGRLQRQLKNSRMVPPCFGQELADHLSCGEIYVSASRFDPGPNHVLEALSCGLKTFVHKDGGGAVEFAGADHAYGSLEELEKILLTPMAELPANSAISLPTWRECIERYAKLFDELTSHMP